MYAADKDGPIELFEYGIGVKQGCSASPLLCSLCLDELETLLEEAAADMDCPMLTKTLLAILLFADDLVLLSYRFRTSKTARHSQQIL